MYNEPDLRIEDAIHVHEAMRTTNPAQDHSRAPPVAKRGPAAHDLSFAVVLVARVVVAIGVVMRSGFVRAFAVILYNHI